MSRATLTQSANTGLSEENGQVRYRTVMLVDDNPLDNFVNKKLLETNRFAENVVVCESGAAALLHLKSCSVSDLPEVIFLDINMPGMDGFQFLDAFAMLTEAHHRTCRVIMLSTSESFKDLNRANRNRYVRKFLNKPLTAAVIGAIKV
jgi:CheY-like chemotaxis protein